MSEVEPNVESELVEVKATPVPVEPRSRAVRPVRSVPKTPTWPGAALGFAWREIVPRVAAALLDAWDRRASRPKPSLSGSASVRPVQRTATRPTGGSGHRHRQRRHQGRR